MKPDNVTLKSDNVTLCTQARLVKSQCTCSSGFSRVMLVTVGHCFKCDRPLVALAVVSNSRLSFKKGTLVSCQHLTCTASTAQVGNRDPVQTCWF